MKNLVIDQDWEFEAAKDLVYLQEDRLHLEIELSDEISLEIIGHKQLKQVRQYTPKPYNEARFNTLPF